MNTAKQLISDRPIEFSNQAPVPQQPVPNGQSLRDCVDHAVNNYFENLDGQDVSDVYNLVLAEVEAPLLEVVMKYTRHNQTRAANVLGLNRGTLRKKLKQYGLL